MGSFDEAPASSKCCYIAIDKRKSAKRRRMMRCRKWMVPTGFLPVMGVLALAQNTVTTPGETVNQAPNYISTTFLSGATSPITVSGDNLEIGPTSPE